MSLYSRRPILIIGTAVFLLIAGTVGYVFIEEWSWLDAFYMTVITLSTVGFGEVNDLSEAGKLFTTGLVVFSVVLIAYGVEFLVSARLGGQYFRRRQMMRQISKMKNHIIICGLGRVGKSAAQALLESDKEVVIIEREPLDLAVLPNNKMLVLEGDATNDEMLLKAGIENAWGLIVCTGDYSINLFVVLSARTLNDQLFIIARSDSINESKMRRAGANRIVSPYEIGGRHMANIAVRPHVTDFFDVVTLDGGLELWLEELVIEPNSELVGQTVGEVDIRRLFGITLVAIMDHGKNSTITPDASTRLEAGMELIVLGTREQLARLGAAIRNE